ncbi:MAG: thiol reductase thioredoxin [Betaproteobacteria bacterium HGW-Betaproteobacteria-10]|nr:MAG: thiol reductase thioredoxin [Betaproteobacteria bacterium HGW-Betaproteobacteria-10]
MTASTVEPQREEIDAFAEPSLIEFGSAWCGHCQRAQALIAEALADFPSVRHRKIEDGPGRRLGRSFGVKLWPTLIFLKQGKEVARLVRPCDGQLIRASLKSLV